jgi:hypothetical protein
MNTLPPRCVLIGDTRGQPFPLIAAQWAALHGMQCMLLNIAEAGFPADGLGPNVLLALSHRTLLSFAAGELRALKVAVWQGATLYVRGGFLPQASCSLSPFGSGAFRVTSRRADRYLLADHRLLPEVLRNETVRAEVNLPVAQLGDSPAQVLVAVPSGGKELAFVFAMRCGSGIIIYDLLSDQTPAGASTPIVRRLADPAARAFELGALAAVGHALGRLHRKPVAYNLVLDDRPRDLDYFSTARVTRWLSHMEDLCPGTRVDFGWTPQYSRPSVRYINALKQFKAGFVWHGLHQHSDHSLVRDPGADYKEGLKLVERIVRRYSVRFQPIMVFPCERVSPEMLRFLPRAGFTAAVFGAEAKPGLRNPLAEFMLHSTPLHELYRDYCPALRRYEAAELTRENLLANAALDLPIIAAAHPFEVGLRRYASLYDPRAPVSSHFDEVLRFARDKRLRPMSLEEIAAEMIDRARPTRELTALSAVPRRIDVAV